MITQADGRTAERIVRAEGSMLHSTYQLAAIIAEERDKENGYNRGG